MTGVRRLRPRMVKRVANAMGISHTIVSQVFRGDIYATTCNRGCSPHTAAEAVIEASALGFFLPEHLELSTLGKIRHRLLRAGDLRLSPGEYQTISTAYEIVARASDAKAVAA